MNTSKVVKRVLIFSICSFALLLPGCWDRVEINDIALVVATGLDRTDDNNLELSVQIVNPKELGGQGSSAGQGGGKLTIVEKATGKTIFDARSKLQEKVARRLFWGHNRVVIIGENLAEEGIRKHIDFFSRHPFPRLRAYAFVTKGKAVDILKVSPDIERGSAEVARELAKLKVGMSVTMKDLLQMLGGEARTSALPLIEIEHEPPNTEGLKLNGTAIFKNHKMVGQIDDKVTRGVLWLRDEIEKSAVTIKPKGAKGYISFHLLRSSTKLIPKIENGNWKITAKILSEDDVVENETKLDIMDPKVVKKIRKQLEKKIDERIHLALKQVQKGMGADIFGFAEAFHHYYPDQWAKVKDQWHEKFPEIEVEIDSTVHIERPGRSSSPQGVPEDEVKHN